MTAKAYTLKMECEECHGMFQVTFRSVPGGRYDKGSSYKGTMRAHVRADDKTRSNNCKGGNSTIAARELTPAQFKSLCNFFYNNR